MTTYFVYHGAITLEGARNLEVLVNEEINSDTERVVLYLCSSGGDVTAGIGLFNFLKAIPIKLNVHCFGICGSVAVTVFLAGRQRTAEPVSSFSLHAASYSEGPRKGDLSENAGLISLPFQRVIGWNRAQMEHYFGTTEEKHVSVEKAKELKIVEDIVSIKFGKEDRIINVRIP